MPPLLILFVGIATVLGLILVLRLNAFLALITAAMLVSVLAPGEVGAKISRVGAAFGSAAGNIAIVIGMAAVIGECMMASGAADRVVRAFVGLLGEKRSPVALAASGYVLAIPVFFDTVFYLLVPLARSFYRRTGKNYLLCILAIAAGGAVTHTLVPPTPGPLIMAATLGIDLGVMILVGMLVAFPAAAVGLLFAARLDRKWNFQMRALPGEMEQKILSDEELPGLWLSLAPVLLPVVLISASTVLTTLANAENAARLTTADLRDASALATAIRSAAADQPSPAARIRSLLPAADVERLLAAEGSAQRELLVELLNARVLPNRAFYDPASDDWDATLLAEAKVRKRLAAAPDAAERTRLEALSLVNKQLSRDRSRDSAAEQTRFNRLLLEAAFPEAVARHVWQTPLRQAADYSDLIGNPNLALFLSTILAMWVYYRQRRPTRAKMAEIVETSLLSAGVIILITAGGGAFGAMLKEAQIGDAIKAMFGGTAASGLFLLFLGFGVSALLKVAQGSSTVAMITTSGMLAAMLDPAQPPPYHLVYLAIAVGAGSLIGSWMNDSGFWIFAKMGGLTEVETLQSWSVLLIVLGLASMTVGVLLSQLLPLV